MVGAEGVGPSTSSLSVKRSTVELRAHIYFPITYYFSNIIFAFQIF